MLSADKISNLNEQAVAATKKLEQQVLALTSEVEAIKSNGGLAVKQQDFLIRAAREKASPAVIAQLKVIEDVAKLVSSQKGYWSSIEFVLGQQRFAEPASSHATIAAWHASRLAKMSLPMLSLEFQHAKETANHALLGLVLSERGGRQLGDHEVADHSQFSLADVEIPGQAVALKAIEVAEANRIYGEHLFAESRGRSSPINKMAAGRGLVQAGLRQNRPVEHAPGIYRDDLATHPSPVADLPAAA